MRKRPKLPGAAEFFAISGAAVEGEEEGRGGRVAESGGEGPKRRARAPGEVQEERGGQEWGPPRTMPEGPTEKVTLYLHPMLLKRLELLKAQLLVEHNLKVTRSQIVEYLLEEGLGNQEAVIAGLLERAE